MARGQLNFYFKKPLQLFLIQLLPTFIYQTVKSYTGQLVHHV